MLFASIAESGPCLPIVQAHLHGLALIGGSVDDWLWATGWAIGLLGVGLWGWLVFGELIRRIVRRGRVPARCPGGLRRVLVVPVREGCWYELTGVLAASDGSITCPECGRRVTPRRQRCVRRCWSRGMLALPLVLMGYGVWVAPRVRAHGWPGAIPTTALIVGMPVMHRILPPHAEWATADQRLVAAYEELARRLRRAETWEWQRSLAVASAPVEAKAWARDPTMAWGLGRLPPGSDLRLCDPCTVALWDGLGTPQLSRSQSRRLLSRVLGAQVEVRRGLAHARAGWWPDVSLKIDFRSLRFFLPRGSPPAVIRARVRGSGQAWEEHCPWILPRDHPLEASERWLEVPAGTEKAEIEVEIRFGARATGPNYSSWVNSIDRSGEWVAWSGVVGSVHIKSEPEAALTSVNEPRDDAQLRGWLSAVQVTLLEDGTPAIVWPDPHKHFTTTGIDCVFAARFEILQGTEVLARGATTRWLPEPGVTMFSHSISHAGDRAEMPYGGPRAFPRAGLRVRFIGDRRLAWSSLPYEAFWDGDVVVPVRFSPFHAGSLMLTGPEHLWGPARDGDAGSGSRAPGGGGSE